MTDTVLAVEEIYGCFLKTGTAHAVDKARIAAQRAVIPHFKVVCRVSVLREKTGTFSGDFLHLGFVGRKIRLGGGDSPLCRRNRRCCRPVIESCYGWDLFGDLRLAGEKLVAVGFTDFLI